MSATTIRPTATEFATIRATAKAATRGEAKAIAMEIGERVSLSGRSINVLAIDPTPEWADSDLYTTHDWPDFKRGGIPSTDGRAVCDFYVYQMAGRERGDLLTNVQAIFEGGRLVWTGILGRFGFTHFGPAERQGR